MDTQTTHRETWYEEFQENMRWIRASIARSRLELDEMRELSRKTRKQLEAVVGPLPKQ